MTTVIDLVANLGMTFTGVGLVMMILAVVLARWF